MVILLTSGTGVEPDPTTAPDAGETPTLEAACAFALMKAIRSERGFDAIVDDDTLMK